VFHITVEKHGTRRPIVNYRFRRAEREAWSQLCCWPGPKPKGLGRMFRPYRYSIKVAMEGAL
jgi:hypothetical protein